MALGGGVARKGAGAAATSPRPLLPGMRWLLVTSGVLVFLAGIQLFVFTERTDVYFAWTVQPPLSAAFLGAGYFAAVAMEGLFARESAWVRGRLVAPTILLFATLTLVATVVHLDRFHLDGPTLGTQVVTWGWIVVYAVVPVWMGLALVAQHRAPGTDPPRQAPIPLWFRAWMGAYAALMVGLGTPMFARPVATAAAFWPWELTPLTGRAVAAWLIGMGFGVAYGLAEDDWTRIRPMAASFLLLTVLQLAALARYPGDVSWTGPRGWLYLVALLNLTGLALYAVTATSGAYRRLEEAAES